MSNSEWQGAEPADVEACRGYRAMTPRSNRTSLAVSRSSMARSSTWLAGRSARERPCEARTAPDGGGRDGPL